jgi:uncharacterized protein (TIGR00369 family)
VRVKIPPFNAYLGSEVVRRDNGAAEVVLELAPHHLNRRGVAHGGVVSSLLDSALGAAVISSIPEEWWCATTSLATQFLDGVGKGTLTATGHVTRRGRSTAFASGEVRAADGRIIAVANGTWHLWPYRPGAGREIRGPYLFPQGGGNPVRVGKIVAVGRNYVEHKKEMGSGPGAPPVLFLKPAGALLHEGEPIRLPAGHGEVHHEVELVVAIGRGGTAIPETQALDHVLGYAVGLDLTLREVQARAKQRGEPWSVAKGFDGSAPVSSYVRRGELGDGSGLDIRLEVNGEVRQHGNTSEMEHGVPALVALVSRCFTLDPGDLIFTGTPAGVGPLQPGDRIEATVEHVGRLRLAVSGPGTD